MTNTDSANVAIHPMVVYAVAVAIAFGLGYIWPLTYPQDPIYEHIGKGLIALGVIICVAAGFQFWRHKTSVDCNGCVTSILTTGVFRISRNPIYLGFILIYIGFSRYWNNIWMLVLLIPMCVALFQLVIAREEAYLERKFGDEYIRYKQKVRRWL